MSGLKESSSRPQVAAGGRNPSPTGHGAKPEAVREKAIVALLSERSIATAAKRCCVGERTLRRWLTKDAAFKAQYAAVRSAMFQVAMDRVQALMSRAVDTLDDLLGAKNQPAVRLGAARTVAELAIHQHDAETIMGKLAEIESAQKAFGSR